MSEVKHGPFEVDEILAMIDSAQYRHENNADRLEMNSCCSLVDSLDPMLDELAKLREIEEAARELSRGAAWHHTSYGSKIAQVDPGALARLRTALDADRGGQGE